MNIYLAGGMKAEWRNEVKGKAPGHMYIDPTEHGLQNWEEYSAWDLSGIDQCDWVFGYLEESNPSGYGLCLEIGYAKGINKRIIFINEYEDNWDKNKYLKIVRFCSDVYFDNLPQGIRFLQSLEHIVL